LIGGECYDLIAWNLDADGCCNRYCAACPGLSSRLVRAKLSAITSSLQCEAAFESRFHCGDQTGHGFRRLFQGMPGTWSRRRQMVMVAPSAVRMPA
jgi:hypothetical protein